MLAPQRHLWTTAEYLPNVLFKILAAQAKQHPGVVLVDEEFLQNAVRRIELNAVGPDFAADSMPQGFVAIDDDDLPRRGLQSANPAGQERAQAREECRRVGDSAQFFAVRIVVQLDGICRRQLLRRD